MNYDQLTVDAGDALLAGEGVLCVSLPARHARACVALIELHRTSGVLRGTHATLRQRLGYLARGSWLALRLLFADARVLELFNAVVLRSSSQSWEPGPDGDLIFRFSR